MVDWKQVTGFDWDTGNGRRSEEAKKSKLLDALRLSKCFSINLSWFSPNRNTARIKCDIMRWG
jgi:hypothetical protein